MSFYVEDFEVGASLPPLVKEPISQTQLVRYAGASGDFNPLHTVEAVGRQTSFGGPIAHGMLIMGFAGQAVAGWVTSQALRQLQVRFVNVTKPGDTISVAGKITAKGEENGEHWVTGELVARDQTEQIKLQGKFRAVLPSREA